MGIERPIHSGLQSTPSSAAKIFYLN